MPKTPNPQGRQLAFAALTFIMIALIPTEASAQAQWTFLVYLDADNDLEEFGIADFLEMASVGSTADVNIVLLFDRAAGYDTSYGNWTDTRRGRVQTGDEPYATWGESVGEMNMGDPQTLTDFVEWGATTYPAANYALILWNHGNGWTKRLQDDITTKTVCWDDSSGDALHNAEVRSALAACTAPAGGLSVIGFDACLMSMVEVAYDLRNYANVMVASEETEPGEGWPYNTLLADLVATPAMDAAGLGTVIVNRYRDSVSSFGTLAATDLTQMDALAAALDSLAGALRTGWNSDYAAVLTAAAAMKTSIETAVIHEQHTDDRPGSHGLAVYFPTSSVSAQYDTPTILLPGVTQWDEFLQEYLAFMTVSWIADTRAASEYYDTPAHIDLYDFCDKLAENVPDDLNVTPDGGFSSSGDAGGPFAPLSMPYTLANTGAVDLQWSATTDMAWLTVSPETGTLSAGESVDVTVAVDASADTLPQGLYTVTIHFSNDGTGVVRSRQATLRVGVPDYFTERFPNGIDLENSTITFTPDGSMSYYAATIAPATAFPVDPTGGANLYLADDASAPAVFSGYKSFPFYGQSYSGCEIGSNGYIIFGAPDSAYAPSLDAHFNLPRISALFSDLCPPDGGTVSWKQITDRVVVTYDSVVNWGAGKQPPAPDRFGTANNVQIELFFDGVLRITWLELAAETALVGLSEGLGVPADFAETDLSGVEPADTTVPGDVSGDGAVNAMDVQFVINAALGMSVSHNCDVDGSGGVNAADVQFVVNATLGKHHF